MSLFLAFFVIFSFVPYAESNTPQRPTAEQLKQFEQLRQESQKRTAEPFIGREVFVRLYSPLGQYTREYQLYSVILNSNVAKLDFGDIAEPAFAVFMPEDQTDEFIAEKCDKFLFAEVYEPGMKLVLPHYSGLKKQIKILDILEKPLTKCNIELVMSSTKLGSDYSISVLTYPNEEGFLYLPDFYGKLDKCLIYISHPDNHGIALINSESWFKKFGISERDKSILYLPWYNTCDPNYVNTLDLLVVDDQNNPLPEIRVDIDKNQNSSSSAKSKSLRNSFFTDEQGRLSVALGIKEDWKNMQDYRNDGFLVQIEPAINLQLTPCAVKLCLEHETKVKLNSDGHYRRFVFIGEDGNEQSEYFIGLTIERKDYQPLDINIESYKRSQKEYYLPNGFYTFDYIPAKYEPVIVNDDSPETIVFKTKQNKIGQFKVFDGSTGKPLENAYLISRYTLNKPFSREAPQDTITDSELRFIKDYTDKVLWPDFIRDPIPNDYRIMGISDANGLLECKFRTDKHYPTAYLMCEGYVPIRWRIDNYDGSEYTKDGRDIMRFSSKTLFPAARVYYQVDCAEEVKFNSVITYDVNNAPKWARPDDFDSDDWSENEFIDVNDVNSYSDFESGGMSFNPFNIVLSNVYRFFTTSRASVFGIRLASHDTTYDYIQQQQMMDFEQFEMPEESEMSEQQWLESQLEENNDYPQYYDQPENLVEALEGHHPTNQKFLFGSGVNGKKALAIVPANVKITLKASPKTGDDKPLSIWHPAVIAENIKLKQGEVLNIDKNATLELAPQFTVTVLDNNQRPVKGINVLHLIRNWGLLKDTEAYARSASTNENGQVTFITRNNYGGYCYVIDSDRPNCRVDYKSVDGVVTPNDLTIFLSEKTMEDAKGSGYIKNE